MVIWIGDIRVFSISLLAPPKVATCSIETTRKCINISRGELPVRPLDVGVELFFSFRTTSTAPEPRSTKVSSFSHGSQLFSGTLFPFCLRGVASAQQITTSRPSTGKLTMRFNRAPGSKVVGAHFHPKIDVNPGVVDCLKGEFLGLNLSWGSPAPGPVWHMHAPIDSP